MQYTVICVCAASTSHKCEADSPDDAIDKAGEELESGLCWSCASTLDVGDFYGFIVLDENGDEVYDDTQRDRLDIKRLRTILEKNGIDYR